MTENCRFKPWKKQRSYAQYAEKCFMRARYSGAITQLLTENTELKFADTAVKNASTTLKRISDRNAS